MTDYSHLTAPTFQTRKILAAHYLRDCRRIIEVGGGKSPIYNFLNDGTGRQFWVVDPDCEKVYHSGVQHCQMGVEAFDFRCIDPRQANAGLCLLGLELQDPNGSAMSNIISNIPRFHTVVTDYVIENESAYGQHAQIFDKMMKEMFHITASIALEFICDDVYERQAEIMSPSFFKKRAFTVFTQD